MRIIGGTLKGKKIDFIKSSITRPLKDVVKESIFNVIQHSNLIKLDLKNSSILDLCSGVGSFGLESISRGAKDVTFVDNDSKALIVLKKNINDLKINEKTTIFSKKIEDFINNFKGKNKFNIVFLDPPFAENFYIKDLELIKKSKICNSNNLVIIHREKKTNDKIDSCLSTLLTKIYGRSKIIFGVLR